MYKRQYIYIYIITTFAVAVTITHVRKIYFPMGPPYLKRIVQNQNKTLNFIVAFMAVPFLAFFIAFITFMASAGAAVPFLAFFIAFIAFMAAAFGMVKNRNLRNG